VRTDFDLEMQTRDGTTLRADVTRPATSTKVPAVVLRTPYNKAARYGRLGGFGPTFAAKNGFAYVVQDVRGRWASEGDYVPISKVEMLDGYDCIEWVAAQPWCSGAVGMIGISYESLAQLMAAEAAPPSLKAIIPEYSGDARLGALMLDSILIGWAAGQALDWIQKSMATGEATADDLDTVMDVLKDPQAAALHLPLDEMSLFKVGSLFTYQEMLAILRAAAGVDYSKIQVPALFVSGYYDIDPPGIARHFSAFRSSAGTSRARQDTSIIWGPWEHGIAFESQGERYFGVNASADVKNLGEMYLQFLRRHLLDMDTSIPTASYFVMGTNEWRESADWPPPDSAWRSWYLSTSSELLDVSGPAGCDSYEYDPHDPTPSFGGRYFKVGGSRPGPYDQRRVEERNDVLVYTSPVLDSPVDAVGDARLILYASSTAVDTDFAVKICDVLPNGLSYNICDAFLRARWRDGTDSPSWLTPGAVHELEITLGPIANVFQAGHRIRLQIASSNFPAFDRNMNTGHPEGSDAKGVVATQTVWRGGDHATRLEMHVRPA
jgi:putative CocE/NonD family hydrolase